MSKASWLATCLAACVSSSPTAPPPFSRIALSMSAGSSGSPNTQVSMPWALLLGAELAWMETKMFRSVVANSERCWRVRKTSVSRVRITSRPAASRRCFSFSATERTTWRSTA